MHIILTGATGLVGSACLHQMLVSKIVTKISILSRRPVPMAADHSQVNVIIHKDFSVYEPEVLEKLKGADGCIWALGVSVVNVSKSDYVKITYDYPLAAAKAFSALSSPFKFIYISGEGATTTPGMLTPYFGVIKGKSEAALLELHKADPNLRPYSVRPAMVDAMLHPEIHPFIPQSAGMMKTIANIIGPIVRTTYKNGVSPTRDLGRVMVELATGDGEALTGDGVEGEGRTVSNKGFRRLAGI